MDLDLSDASKINILGSHKSLPFWQVFREGVLELEREQQTLVNDMSRSGPQHDADRLRRKFYEELADGEILQQLVNRLKAKITEPEPKKEPQ